MTARLTVITADQPLCVTKQFWLNADGSLGRRTTAHVTAGRMEIAEAKSISDFGEILHALMSNQAVAYGIPLAAPVALVSEEAWAAEGRPELKLPRTRKTMRWPAGQGVMMLDYDPAPDGEPLSRDALVAAIRSAAPGLAAAAMLWWPSTSSRIFNGDTELRGIRGQRLYAMVEDAADIPRAGKALEAALWAAGRGYYTVSLSGSLLPRTLVDSCVWQPERIDFAAGALCKAPIEQRRGAPVLVPGSFQIIDTAAAMPDPDQATLAAANENKAAARAAVSAQATAVREAWIGARAQTIVDRIKPAPDAAERTLVHAQFAAKRAVERSELLSDWTVAVVTDGSRHEVPVAALLDNPSQYHGALCLDPIEPDYDGTRPVGKLYLFGARPTLHSFAHGGTTYRLMRQPGRTELVRGKEHDTVLAVLERLRQAPEIFDFGTELVVVDAGRAHPLNADVLRHHLGGLTQFWRWHKMPDGSAVEVLENPPLTVARSILGMGDRRRLRVLTAVITAPTLRPDGTVLSAPGYDAATGLLLELDELPVQIPAKPTIGEARAALDRLWQAFSQFPFAAPVDRGVMLAALITAVARPALPTAPAFGFDAPVQGSGKTLLGKCLGALATGEPPTLIAHTDARQGDEEVRKRIFSLLREGARAVLWDNVTGIFDSPSFAAALTAERMTDRVLGVSQTASVPNRALFVLTGNNLTMAGDMPRRVLRCRIDPQSETPFTREFDLDPVAHCLAHRQTMAAAALTLVRAWLTSGDARAPGRTASFEGWDDFVRQAVVWCIRRLEFDGADPIDAITEATASDPEHDAWHEFLAAWSAVLRETDVTAKAVLDAAKPKAPDYTETALGAAMAEFAAQGKHMTARSLGRVLMYRKDRIVGGLVLRQRPKHRDGSLHWAVTVAPTRKTAGFEGFAEFKHPTHKETVASTHIRDKQTPQTPQTPQESSGRAPWLDCAAASRGE